MRRRLREAGKSLASNFQQAYTPTEVSQGDENNSSVYKANTTATSAARSSAEAPRVSSALNEQSINSLTGNANIESGKTGGKNSKVKPILVFACLVMLSFLIYSGICYRKWWIAQSQRQEAGQGTVGQAQQTEQPESTGQGAPGQKQVDDQAAREAERRRQEAAAREAGRQREEAAAREAGRQREEAAAREAGRQREEEEEAEAERQREEAAAREAE